MEIIFTNHSQIRIEERGISLLRIRETIKKPDKSQISYLATSKVSKKYGNKTLEVVFRQNRGKVVVITAYYL
ncbi:MAG: DUF4258 domain-containing protein [Candidatus Vogelbacteria bacterium]|nr:DUF4258 domain-containing protein [Candidatus Vogelbacteria bacterium]